MQHPARNIDTPLRSRHIVQLLIQRLLPPLLYCCTIALFPGAVTLVWSGEEPMTEWLKARSIAEQVMQEQGRIPSDLEEPPWYDVPYSVLGRMPLIDSSLRQPLIMPEIALKIRTMVHDSGFTMAGLLSVACLVSEENRMLPEGVAEPEAVTESAWIATIRQDLKATTVPVAWQEHIIEALSTLAASHGFRERAYSKLTPIERERVTVLLPGWFVKQNPWGETIRGYTTSTDECVELLALLRKVDWSCLYRAAGMMAALADRLRDLCDESHSESLKEKDANREELLPKGRLFDTMTPLGRVIIGGFGDDRYDETERCVLLIDPDGNDRYFNRPASTDLASCGATLHLDCRGNDIYDDRGFGQGSAAAGTAVFMDLAGDDCYRSGHYSQGAALGGFSFFYDGGGDDLYDADVGVQGFAIFGTSIFIDAGGRDTYRCDSNGQGAASTLGIALFIEQGGDDIYRAGGSSGFYYSWDSSTAQGAASGMRPWPPRNRLTVAGGIGILLDSGGNDLYHAYNIGQGGSYVFGLGILVDDEGNDTYSSKNYCRGVGVHLSAGVALDLAGDDLHNGLYGQNGYSLDRSSGVFLDFSGNDTYRTSGGIGFGHKPKGAGFFFDLSGDDTYAGWENNYGKADWPFGDDTWSTGFFLDAGGKDRYPDGLYGDNRSWQEGTFGWGSDREGIGADAASPLEPWWRIKEAQNGEIAVRPEITLTTELPKEKNTFLELLTAPSSLIRFSASDPEKGSIDSFLAAAMIVAGSSDRQARTGLIDLFQYLLVEHRIEEKHLQLCYPLISTPDRDMALLGLSIIEAVKPKFNRDTDTKMLKLAQSNSSPEVRAAACRMIGECSWNKAAGNLITALDDSDWRVRRQAARALGRLASKKAVKQLQIALQRDPFFQVRAHAAESLGKIGDSESRSLLQSSLSDPEPFVQTCAARALLRGYDDKSAMKVLIDLVAWENYPLRNDWVIDFLRAYSGVDFGTDLEAWTSWWSQSSAHFSCAANRKVYHKFVQAEELRVKGDNAAARGEFRSLHRLAPDHVLVVKRLSELLNSSAWDAAVKGEKLEEARSMAKEAVILDYSANTIDTLAVLHFLCNDRESAEKLLLEALSSVPENQKEQLEDRLAQIRQGQVSVR